MFADCGGGARADAVGLTCTMASGAPAKQVAESCFSFLHTEVVNMSLSPEPTASELQLVGRKLEAMGFQVGQRLAERYTKDRPRFIDTLEIIKFICKDFWFEIYGKQIDKLQTNNRVSVPKSLRPGSWAPRWRDA